MKHLIFLIPSILLVLAACKKELPQKTADQQIEEMIKAHVVFGRTPGIAVGTYHNGVEKQYFFGTKDLSTGEKIDEFTLFDICSITKTFTALLSAQMIIEHQFELNDTVQNYMPEGFNLPQKNGIPIRFIHLLNHTSGLKNLPPDVVSEEDAADFDAAKLSDYLKVLELNATPGSVYEYSNLGMGIMGWLVGEISAKNYDQVLKEKVCSPLALNYTRCNPDALHEENMCRGYYGNEAVSGANFSEVFMASGALKSNLHDMMLYLKENIDPKNVSLKNAFNMTKQNTFDVNDHLYIGLGFHITIDASENEIVWHNGGSKGFSSFMGYNRTTNDGVVVLMNAYCFGEQDRIGIEILNLLVEDH